MSTTSPHRPERTTPMDGADPGVPTEREGPVRRPRRRAGHFPSRRERLVVARAALGVARAALRHDPWQAAAEVHRAREEVRSSLLSSPRDDLVEVMLLLDGELEAVERHLPRRPVA